MLPAGIRLICVTSAETIDATLAIASQPEAIADRFHVPIVMTGFEPVDLWQGIQQPPDCPAFGTTRCTLEHPLGAPMVSLEGACAAYYRYHGSLA